MKATMQIFSQTKGKNTKNQDNKQGKLTFFNYSKPGYYAQDCRSKKQSNTRKSWTLAMIQIGTDLPKKLKQKILLKQPIQKEPQKFKTNYFWPPPSKRPPKSIIRKALQLFKSLNHAIIF